jgi:uncharacterized protein YbjT (DUF2867 family)
MEDAMTTDRARDAKPARTVAVLGAAGHTGRFVVAELLRRGLTPIAVARDASRLRAMGYAGQGVDCCEASIDDPGALDRALAGAAAVVRSLPGHRRGGGERGAARGGPLSGRDGRTA